MHKLEKKILFLIKKIDIEISIFYSLTFIHPFIFLLGITLNIPEKKLRVKKNV